MPELCGQLMGAMAHTQRRCHWRTFSHNSLRTRWFRTEIGFPLGVPLCCSLGGNHLERVLNPDDDNVTIATLQRAAKAVGRTLRLELA